jgi:hypothetical protein
VKNYDLTILQITSFDGETYEGGDAIDHIEEADQVFYSITFNSGEEFYRWVAGPFEDLDTLEAAIQDEVDFYEELAAT